MPLVSATLAAGIVIKKFAPVVIKTAGPAITTMMVKAPEIIETAKKIKTIRDGIVSALQILRDIQKSFGSNQDWAGDDYVLHEQRHRQLCDDIQELEECLYSCHQFLIDSANEYEQAQQFSKDQAEALSSPRGR